MQDQHPSSAGRIIKKITEINPRLGVKEIAAIIKAATEKVASEQFAGSSDRINEAKAIALAQASLKK